MSTISRELPRTVEGRLMFLTTAKAKEATLPVGTIIISAATKTRLLSIENLYRTADQTRSTKLALSADATETKNLAQAKAKMWCSHYYQALNNAIDRGVYPASVRGYYSLPVSSGAVPNMESEEKLTLWGGRVTSGEAAMVLAGHPPVGWPTQVEVKPIVDDYNDALTAQTVAAEATDNAEEALENHNEEADKVIKKVADEVETFYNEENVESMRNNAREWGVKYITLGELTQITFKAERADTHAGIEAAVFKIKITGTTYTAGPDGSVELETRLIGDEEVEATHPEYVTLTQTITIVEGVGMTVVFLMVPIV